MYSVKELDIEKFMFLYTDTLLLLYEDLYNQYSPYFLCHLRSGDITSFVTDCVFDENDITFPTNALLNLKQHTSHNFQQFVKMYISEIRDSHSLVQNVLKDFKYTLKPNTWSLFCFVHSDLNEITQ
jgi:hypothetical protein